MGLEWAICRFLKTSRLVTYARPPLKLSYILNDQALTINGQELLLQNFRAFTVETAKVNGNDDVPVTIQLFSKRRIALAVVVFLPDNEQDIENVIAAFGKRVQFDEAKAYLSAMRTLDRLASWLRLI